MSPLTDRPPLSRRRLIVGDAGEALARLPDRSVDMVLTSPPYFRLRDYGGGSGQLGLEPHVDDWASKLVAFTREVARVLVTSGSLWLNLGDTYSGHPSQGAARKGLLLGPERVTLQLSQEGWLVRNKIIWAKSNHLPTSARDRLACSYELLFVLTRSPRYFFDLDALRVPHRSRPPKPRAGSTRQPARREAWRGPNGDDTSGLAHLKALGRVGHPLGKNPGDVWQLPVSAHRSAHHAVFPVSLATRAITAACPERRCERCYAPHVRTLHRLGATAVRGALRPSCRCRAASQPGLVLDPFMGAGTTAVAAEQLGRDWVGVEINPLYALLARQRIEARRRSTDTWQEAA